MEQTPEASLSAVGPDWQFLKRALGSLALEITERAVLGCFEPKPISSCYDDELPRARQAILRARDGKLARFRYQVNRNAFLIACRDYADEKPEEHLIIGYGFRHGSTGSVIDCAQLPSSPGGSSTGLFTGRRRHSALSGWNSLVTETASKPMDYS